MEISNTITTDQVAFLAVLPGVSTKKQVEATLGTPESPSQYVPSVWAYRDLGVNLTFSTNDEGNEIVKSITASGELYGESLEEIIQEFGCPSAIIGFKYSLHDVQSKNYTDLTLIYLEGGIAFHFPPSILNIREKPIGLHYFIPGTFDEYIMNYMGSVDLSIVKLFDWEEVVRLEP